jgi:hypothetical protein
MRVPRTLSVSLLTSVFAAALFAGSCQGERPVAPDMPSAAPAGREGTAHASAQNGGNQPPTAVFKTTPLANDESVIVGGSSLDVTFNLCQSSDPDEGDALKFWFDYDGDGKADEWGHCRATHHYQVKEFESACVFTKVCVGDRQADHAVCHTYEVCTFGKPRPSASPSPSGSPEPSPSPSGSPGPSPSPDGSPSPSPSPSPSTSPSPSPEPTPTPPPELTDQKEDGDFAAPSSKDIWSFDGSAGADVTVKLDTVSEETAYIMSFCLSTSTRRIDCVKPTFKARVDCAFDDRFVKCPVRSYLLPPNQGRYYLIVNGFRFGADQPGQYTLAMTAHPGTGPLNLDQDNVSEDPFFEQ